MLEPTTRTLFTDALRPPSGHTLDLAVGTTYTLSLRMLLLPPLAMAAHDRETELPSDEVGPGADTLALLESVRRYADRTTVYCHAGGIGAPGSYPALLTFAEDCVVQVVPDTPGRIFHPKLWALRFRKGDAVIHRLVVSSRNLTEDTSWDTLLVLDEGQEGKGIDGRPAADFVRQLPTLALGPVAAGRATQAHDLAATLSQTWFTLPDPFTAGAMWPLGTDASRGWPMPLRPARALVVSPFLDPTTATRVAARSRPVVVSRPETYVAVGSRALEHADVRVLSPHAEAELAGDEIERQRPSEVRTGLHAKLLVWDEDGTGHLFTGSANATTAAFSGNVEFGVLLTGPRRTCGVEAMLPPGEPSRDRIAFGQILEEHAITAPDPQPDQAFQAELQIERFHAELLRAGPQLTIEPEDGDRFTVSLDFQRPLPFSPGSTKIRLISRPRTERVPVGPALWSGIRLLDLTPYLEALTQVPLPETTETLEIACVIKADLIDDPQERATAVLRSYLGSEDSIVRYLRFLLDDDNSGPGWDDLDVTGGGRQQRTPRQTFEDLAILEPLLRAASQGSESLGRVQALLRDLGADRDEKGVVPAEFLDLWEAIWSATGGDDR